MSTLISRISGLGGALLLAACQQAAPQGEAKDKAVAPASPIETVKRWVEGVSDDRPKVACAMSPADPLAQDCPVETLEDAQSRVVVVYRPDGGFRRLRVGAKGEIVAADGALEVRSARTDQAVGVMIDGERYALPLAVLGGR